MDGLYHTFLVTFSDFGIGFTALVVKLKPVQFPHYYCLNPPYKTLIANLINFMANPIMETNPKSDSKLGTAAAATILTGHEAGRNRFQERGGSCEGAEILWSLFSPSKHMSMGVNPPFEKTMGIYMVG